MSFLSDKKHKRAFHSWNLAGGTCDASLVRGEHGGIMEASGSIWEASWKHLGGIWASRRPIGFGKLLEAIITILLS